MSKTEKTRSPRKIANEQNNRNSEKRNRITLDNWTFSGRVSDVPGAGAKRPSKVLRHARRMIARAEKAVA